MLSLRSFHIFFIILAMLCADFFGIWCVYDYLQAPKPLILTLGILALLGGIGLLFYAFWFIQKLDRKNIH